MQEARHSFDFENAKIMAVENKLKPGESIAGYFSKND